MPVVQEYRSGPAANHPLFHTFITTPLYFSSERGQFAPDMPSNPMSDRRSFVGATVAAAMAGVAGCNAIGTAPRDSTDDALESWPTPRDGQREVMLLGTSHLAQTPGDTLNALALDAGNVLGERRQAELETLTDRLAEWRPDRIAVEYESSQQSTLDSAFTAYTTDTRDVDEVSGWKQDRRSEIVQVGFRLADKLGHDSVAAVDHNRLLTALMTDEERQRMPDPPFIDPESVEYPLVSPSEYIAREQRRLDEGSLLDHYKRLNAPEPGSLAWMNDQALYATAFEHSEPGEYGMVKLMTAWMQRNLRIASNIWNVPAEDDERVLVVYGAAHVPGLKQILTGTPMMVPVNPLPFIDG